MSEFNADRLLYLGPVNEGLAEEAVTGLQKFEMESPEAPIRVIVNSYGGSTDAMFAIYDAMSICQAPIVTVGIGVIMSAGVILLAAGDKGERRIAPRARLMIHGMRGSSSGKLYEMENDVTELRRVADLYDEILASETGLSVDQAREITEDRKDNFLSAEDAIEYGIVDKIVTP